jgi:hypothetical protein
MQNMKKALDLIPSTAKKRINMVTAATFFSCYYAE